MLVFFWKTAIIFVSKQSWESSFIVLNDDYCISTHFNKVEPPVVIGPGVLRISKTPVKTNKQVGFNFQTRMNENKIAVMLYT